MLQRFRLYVDESGDAQMRSLVDDTHRYLGLTGVAMLLKLHDRDLTTELDQLKTAYFRPHSPETPVILVRTELIRCTGAFSCLADATVREHWEGDMFAILRRYVTKPITVVIDKMGTQRMYGERDEDPYLRAMRYMLERYRAMLHFGGGEGDVLVESRGGSDDSRLKRAYEQIYKHGTQQLSGAQMRKVLTTKELKLQKKSANVAGLQIADLVANPARLSLLQELRGFPRQDGKFTQRVADLITPAYHWANRVLYPRDDP